MDTSRRVPLSITLREDLAAFALRCADSQEIGSLDEFFDTAVEVLQMRLDVFLQSIDEQETKGRSEEDLAHMKCKITLRPQDH